MAQPRAEMDSAVAPLVVWCASTGWFAVAGVNRGTDGSSAYASCLRYPMDLTEGGALIFIMMAAYLANITEQDRNSNSGKWP